MSSGITSVRELDRPGTRPTPRFVNPTARAAGDFPVREPDIDDGVHDLPGTYAQDRLLPDITEIVTEFPCTGPWRPESVTMSGSPGMLRGLGAPGMSGSPGMWGILRALGVLTALTCTDSQQCHFDGKCDLCPTWRVLQV